MKIQSYRDVEPSTEIPGVSLHTVISAADGAPRFSMRVFEVQPGASTPFHSHWWEHEVFILKGEGVVVGGTDEHAFGPEDVIYVEPGERHQFRNGGSGEVEFLCLIPASTTCLRAGAPRRVKACEVK